MSDKEFTPTEPILVDAPVTDTPDAPTEDKPIATEAEAPTAPTVAPTMAPTEPKPPMAAPVDDLAYQQYQALAIAVLDSADIASKSAEAAASASRNMHKATSEFKTLTEVGHKKALLLLGATGGLLIICLVFFLVMGVRMNSRINQLDTMMLAVGKRVIDLNSGLESLDVINRSIESVNALQVEQGKSQALIEQRINEAMKKSDSVVQGVPSETARQVAASSDNLLRQVQAMNGRLQTQANAVQALGNEVKALKGAVGTSDKLNRDVEALVTLQKERYLENLQKNNVVSNRDKAVQFPRVTPAKAPGDATPQLAAPK
jgi:hypothetical protein